MAEQTPAKGEERRRRTERVLLRIPIEVKGTATGGEPFSEKTFTLVVNRDGARIGLKTLVRPNDRLSITNLQNRVCCPFRVVERATDTLGDGSPEFGVECLEPDVNVWGINFPTKTAAPAKEEMVDALLECSKCNFRELAQLTLEQYRGLISQSSVSRDCGKCAARTDWVFGFVEAEPDEAAAAAPDPASSSEGDGIERRRAKRVTVKLPVRLRLDDGRDEVARTENLSKTGVCFASDLDLKRGDALKVTVGYAAGANAAEIRARVVWRRPAEGTTAHALYGVRLEEETS